LHATAQPHQVQLHKHACCGAQMSLISTMKSAMTLAETAQQELVNMVFMG
jgi:hypothetical protein